MPLSYWVMRALATNWRMPLLTALKSSPFRRGRATGSAGRRAVARVLACSVRFPPLPMGTLAGAPRHHTTEIKIGPLK